MGNVVTKVPESVFDYLSMRTLDALKPHLANCRNILDLEYCLEWLKEPNKWKLPRVSFDTFIDSKQYLGMGEFVYPQIRKTARDIIQGNFSEGVIVAGIGSGKTTLAELIACYSAHTLLCLRDPHRYYRLAKDKPIVIMNMGTTATQALEVTFAGIKGFIEKSPWFLSHNPQILQGKIRFNSNDILLISGNSKSTTPLGYNIFYAVLDEAAFYLDNENKQVAEDIYNSLQRRIVSRFGHDGLVLMISSPKYEGDFIMQKIDEAKKLPDVIYARQMPTWKCRPLYKADLKNYFYFNCRTSRLTDTKPEGVGVINSIYNKDFDSSYNVWQIPGEYKSSFVQDPDKAKRDFAAVPSKTIEGFFKHPEIVAEMFDDRPDPVKEDGKYSFSDAPLRTSYYIHIDLGLNRKGKGDCAGLAMAHCEGFRTDEVTGEKKKIIKVDLAERITAGPTGEVEFEDVRQKIYSLKAMGYNIRLVTLDSFQSIDTMQIFKSKGIKSEYLSVDRNIEPYNSLKSLAYEKRIKIHKMPKLQEEINCLEINKASKVDHPPGSSKDISDAVTGAVYNALTLSGGEMGARAAKYYSEPSPTHPTLMNKQQKEEYYQRLRKMVDSGITGI